MTNSTVLRDKSIVGTPITHILYMAVLMFAFWPVSYTHLDVYKRQAFTPVPGGVGTVSNIMMMDALTRDL